MDRIIEDKIKSTEGSPKSSHIACWENDTRSSSLKTKNPINNPLKNRPACINKVFNKNLGFMFYLLQ